MKKNEFILLKSKDDFTFEHYKNSPLTTETGFFGTAGEAVKNKDTGKITLFVDPRYHIQAEIQTKGKNVEVVKMPAQFGLIHYIKEFLPQNSTLFIPEKSTSYLFYEKLKKELEKIEIKTYKTEDDESSIDDITAPVFEVPVEIAGKTREEKIKKIKIENFLITNLEEIAYLLNLRSYKTKNSAVFRAKLFIKNNKKAVLFTDYEIPPKSPVVEIKPMAEFKKYIKEKQAVNIDKNSISIADFNLIKAPLFIEKNPITKMASIKNESEINHFKNSFKRLDEALFSFRKKIKAGLSEFELNEIFENELKQKGAITTSFKTILAIGENSSIIHYTANSKEKILKKGDIILLDCGGYYEGGYATDITRVFWCKDNKGAAAEVKEIYTAVLKAQLNCYRSKILEGDILHNLADKIMKKYNRKGFNFPHGLGHGIGIPVHQTPPTLTNKLKFKLKNNNVFSIEPGLYKEGAFGVRLENTVYLDKDKKVSLSHFPYEEELINYEMLNKRELKWLSDWQNEAKRIYG